MCRALKVLCVAPDAASLAELKRASVSADWELASGAIGEERAMAQLGEEQPHVVVAFGELGDLVQRVRATNPFLRIVTDRDLPGASVVVASLEEVRAAVKELPRPGGPVR